MRPAAPTAAQQRLVAVCSGARFRACSCLRIPADASLAAHMRQGQDRLLPQLRPAQQEVRAQGAPGLWTAHCTSRRRGRGQQQQQEGSGCVASRPRPPGRRRLKGVRTGTLTTCCSKPQLLPCTQQRRQQGAGVGLAVWAGRAGSGSCRWQPRQTEGRPWRWMCRQRWQQRQQLCQGWQGWGPAAWEAGALLAACGQKQRQLRQQQQGWEGPRLPRRRLQHTAARRCGSMQAAAGAPLVVVLLEA